MRAIRRGGGGRAAADKSDRSLDVALEPLPVGYLEKLERQWKRWPSTKGF
jgi:hypothetical protein